MDYKKMKNRLIITIILVMTLVSTLFLTIGYNKLHTNISDDILNKKMAVKRAYGEILNNLYITYMGKAKDFALTKDVARALRNRDRDALYSLVIERYEEMKKDNPFLEVMHFILPDNTSLLRVHKLDKYGDDLTNVRPMIRDTNKNLTINKGFEIGKHGISYRVSVPVHYLGKYVGVLEFGVNVNYILELSKKVFGVESAIFFDTKALELLREKETRLKDTEIINGYTMFGRDNVIFSSIKNIEEEELYENIKIDSKEYVVYEGIQITNYQHKVVGKTILAQDITKDVADLNMYIMSLFIATIFLLILISVMLAMSFNKLFRIIEEKQEELTEKNKLLEDLSNTDPLTKLKNRRRFAEIMEYEINRSKRYKSGICLALVDVDHFKKINDVYGHDVGDLVLMGLATLLQNNTRSSDVVARWGGEEFIILYVESELDNCYAKIDRLRELVSEHIFESVGHITISIGISKYIDGENEQDLIKRADNSLYEAKKNGRNQVCKC